MRRPIHRIWQRLGAVKPARDTATCQVEQPDLSKVAADYAGRAGFVGISRQDTVDAGRAYQRRFGVSYPLANNRSGKTWARWAVPIPAGHGAGGHRGPGR